MQVWFSTSTLELLQRIVADLLNLLIILPDFEWCFKLAKEW